MIRPSDKEYQETKKIILGKEEMNPDFKPLANFIDDTFNVKVVNIIYDTIGTGQPRLNICFEFEHESQRFNMKSKPYTNFDRKKQQMIAEKFTQLTDKEKYKAKGVFVIYSAFQPVAMIEATEKISLEKFQKQLNNKDIWTISRLFTGVTFFLYTDEQVKTYESSPIKKVWADRYFDLLKKYDKFGYFHREKFDIYLDSKENFDNNYNSNWMYYYSCFAFHYNMQEYSML